MAHYTYTKESDGQQVAFKIYSGTQRVASARLMVPTVDFESYAVIEAFRGLGLSYALTSAMLVYCQKKKFGRPQVSNAHGVLLNALPQVGFHQVGPTRVIKRTEAAASFLCGSVTLAIAECARKMAAHHITLRGPVKTGSNCVIL